jgi:hypothetical protein
MKAKVGEEKPKKHRLNLNKVTLAGPPSAINTCGKHSSHAQHDFRKIRRPEVSCVATIRVEHVATRRDSGRHTPESFMSNAV